MKQLIPTNDYEAYKKRQWKNVEKIYELKNYSKHLDIISKIISIKDISKNSKVLCIGARYGVEVNVFEDLGFSNINAIDIYPRSTNVEEGDMHKLSFKDDLFNIIYTHHSLDHSLFPKQAVKEMYRVSDKNAVWIHTIPYDDFGKEEAIDFDSSNEIEAFLEPYTHEIIYKQQVYRRDDGCVVPAGFCLPKGWKNELRLIIKINK